MRFNINLDSGHGRNLTDLILVLGKERKYILWKRTVENQLEWNLMVVVDVDQLKLTVGSWVATFYG